MEKTIDIMVVGAQKAGSTSLYQYLIQHPGVDTHIQREMTFFVNDHEYETGYPKAYSRYFKDTTHGSLLMAKHVHAMYSSKALQRLYQHNPEMHIIVVLRNPVDRAYSAYLYARRMGWEATTSFEEGLAAEKQRLAEGWESHKNNTYVLGGMYYNHLRKIYGYFSKEQVSVYTTDDLKDNAASVTTEIYSRLGLSTYTPDTSKQHNPAAQARSEPLARLFAQFINSRGVFRRLVRALLPDKLSCKLRYLFLTLNEQEFTPPPMSSITNKKLVEIFKEPNFKLGKLLGRELSAWDQLDSRIESNANSRN